MTIALSGQRAAAAFAAAIPPPGMWTSSRITSGAVANAASTAAGPVATSATTTKPSSSSALRTPSRVGAWSSAITTDTATTGTPSTSVSPYGEVLLRHQHRSWQRHLDRRTPHKTRYHRERPSERVYPLAHAHHAE